MPATAVERPIVRSFKRKYAKEAAAHVRAGGHAVLWETDKRAFLVFLEPAEGADADFGALAQQEKGWEPLPTPARRVWTDDYSNIVGAMLRNFGE